MVLREDFATIVVEMIIAASRDLRALNVAPQDLGKRGKFRHQHDRTVFVHVKIPFILSDKQTVRA